MKPETTLIGNLFDRMTEVCGPKLPPVTYSVGDWVYAERHSGSKTRRLYLARIESAQRLKSRSGDDLWLVRVYHSRSKQGLRGGWRAAESRKIARALNPTEVAHARKMGIIPPAGQALP